MKEGWPDMGEGDNGLGVTEGDGGSGCVEGWGGLG